MNPVPPIHPDTPTPHKVCVFCGGNAGKHGNNPAPLYRLPNVCCDACNLFHVVKRRIEDLQKK